MERKTWATRFVKLNTSAAMIIPKEVREAMGLRPSDLIVMRLFGKLLIARRLDPNQVVDVTELPADALPSAVKA